MSLLLVELNLNSDVQEIIRKFDTFAQSNAGELIETQVTAEKTHAFLIVEVKDLAAFKAVLAESDFSIRDVAKVKLVGADVEDIKASKPAGNYLVEWDLPEGLTMEKYLARKKEKAPLYDQVPEVQFLRTYVREDMVKCLCFYDGETAEDVARAREVVSAPIDRLHKLEEI